MARAQLRDRLSHPSQGGRAIHVTKVVALAASYLVRCSITRDIASARPR
jgi:hypothetical protein